MNLLLILSDAASIPLEMQDKTELGEMLLKLIPESDYDPIEKHANLNEIIHIHTFDKFFIIPVIDQGIKVAYIYLQSEVANDVELAQVLRDCNFKSN